VGISANSQLRTVCNGDRPAGIALWVLAGRSNMKSLVTLTSYFVKKRTGASDMHWAAWRIFRTIAFAAVVFTATSPASVETCAQNAPASSSAAASAQQLLPELRYVRTLPAPNEFYNYGTLQSGTSRLTWSPDGERLAAYIRSGLAIMTWSPDGKYQYEFPRYASFGLYSYLLGFVSGHSQIITSPAAERRDSEEEEKVTQNAFSVMDPATGKVLRGVPGPNPGKTFRENLAQHYAISPDQSLLAVIYHPYAGRSIGVYSTRDWQRIAEIEIGDSNRPAYPQALSFSPDGTKLVVAHGNNTRVDIFEVGSWTLLRSIEAFPEKTPPMRSVLLTTTAFSPDGTMIAVTSLSGGTYWHHPNGSLAPAGVGKPVEEFPPDPLRVFKVEDGSLVASASGFPGGFLNESKIAWIPNSGFIAFLDNEQRLHLWSPTHPGPPALLLALERTTTGLAFSPDGAQLATNFANGVKIFDVIAARRSGTDERKSK
jgi:WD40 repeat protein